MGEEDFAGKLVDKIFEMKRSTFYLIIIFIVGFILRLIAAINLSVSADDMHFVTHAINFFSSGRLVTYDQSSGLWFAFTDIMYNLFGTTQLASRLAALIFGSFTIIAIYLLSREFFNEKISLMSAFLLAIAPFHIKYTVAEMDVMAMFFVISGMYLFIRAIKTDKVITFITSGIFIGLSIYTKVYPLLFIPSLLLYFAYSKRKLKNKIITKRNIKTISIFLLAIFIFTIPAITHNYLLYKDKGFLDLQFTRTLGLGKETSAQYYSWDAQFNAKNSWKGLIFGDKRHMASGTPLLLGAINFVRIGDPINFYLGILGIGTIFFFRKEKKNYIVFLLLNTIFVLPFLASIILLSKHFIFLELLLIPAGAFFLYSGCNYVSKKFNRNITKILVICLLIISLMFLGLPHKSTGTPFYGKSHIAQIIDFKDESIPDGALIVADSRIYRGRINWVSQGRPYLEGTEFIKLLNNQNQIQGEIIPTDIYYFECALDDCGWGGIKDQPEFNASMESLTTFFKENGKLVKEIREPSRAKLYYPIFTSKNKETVINIYTTRIPLKKNIIEIASRPKNWFLYSIGYEPKWEAFDYYNPTTPSNVLLNKLAHLIVTISLILAFLSPLYLIYLFIKK